jgi:hypothetical protein
VDLSQYTLELINAPASSNNPPSQ